MLEHLGKDRSPVERANERWIADIPLVKALLNFTFQARQEGLRFLKKEKKERKKKRANERGETWTRYGYNFYKTGSW